MNKRNWVVLVVLIAFIAACVPNNPMMILDSGNVPAGSVATAVPDLQPASTPALQITPTPALSQFTLTALKDRTYGNGEFTVDRLWYSYERFKRYYVIYDSDGLSIHGFVNVPNGEGPFPVIIALHGFIPADEYQTLDYSTRYADNLASHGYIVLHPNMRNFPPSDSVTRGRDNNTGFTIDVLNLLAYLREMAGKEGIFATADITRMGIWGHSIGGNIAMRVLSMEPDTFKAALLYAPVSQRRGNILDGTDTYDFSQVKAHISIHHGENDKTISVEDSRKLCSQLEQLGIKPDCFFYEGQPHTFFRDQSSDPLLMERTLELFDLYVKNG